MGIEEGEEGQAKGISNMFNKIITENFPNLKKVLPIHIQEAPRTPNRFDQNRPSSWNIIIKTTSTVDRERILKGERKKKQIMYKGKSIKIRADFLEETIKARRALSEVFPSLNENILSPGILYPTKVSFKTDRGIKIFHDKHKLKQYKTTKPSLQKIL
jgi:hypothetical protein